MENLVKVIDVETIEYEISKYPKTDYTYSPLSRDRVELAPGQVAVPNMSRRSLSQFRLQGPSADEPDIPYTRLWTATRKRITTVDSSDDEGAYMRSPYKQQQHWWITQLLLSLVTAVTTTTRNAYRKVFGPPHRYPYTERRPKGGIVSSAASAAAAPFHWIYAVIRTVITTTVTTITETFTSDNISDSGKEKQRAGGRRWPWLLLLLLPACGYGLHYTYENMEHLAMPNFTDFYVDLSEFSLPSLPAIELPELPKLNISMPEINITLPSVYESLPAMPEVAKTYTVYKQVVQDRMADASSYVEVVAASCWEEMRRVWTSYAG